MPESPSIPRRKAGDNEFSFERLRSEAIGYIEEVSGSVWSDYNLHDPGITILEQLIYAITDLGYRCDFPVQDYLTNAKGELDLEAQALHPAHEILTCRPTTPADYRKLLLNALPEIDNLWFDELTRSADDGENARPVRGLYRLALKLAQDVRPEHHDAIEQKIREIYRGARNLCEDLGEVVVTDNLAYELHAQIEVSGAYNPAAILADIYFRCERFIAGSPAITTYDQIDVEGSSLDRLFDGPYTERGFFLDDSDRRGQAGISVTALFAIVKQVHGVEQIKELYLRRHGQNYHDQIPAPGPDQAVDLAIPRTQRAIEVKLSRSDRALQVSIGEFEARYHEIRFKDFASRGTDQDRSLLYRPIEADARPLRRYFSIQDHFPAVYGVNRFGVPESAAAEVKGRVRQLKAYLLLFEQYLVNFLANLDSLDRLFSPETESQASYATQAVDARQVSDLDAVYPDEPEQVFREISAGFDNFVERKGRLLDYLLALYGERFNQRSLRHFNYYYARDRVDHVILANKVAFLRDIVALGRDRGAAADYLAQQGTATSGLARRAALLLDFVQPEWLTGVFEDAGLELVAHAQLEDRLGDGDILRVIGTGELEAAQPAQAPGGADRSPQQLRARLGATALLDRGMLSETLLTEGIDIRHYRIGRGPDGENFSLYFELEPGRFWQLGRFDDESTATRAANDLRQYLLRLNRHSEGIHLVEHLMLRPRLDSSASLDAEFYSFRISAVMPAWTRRCREADFRNLVSETLRLNAPAHLLVRVYWLEFEQMRAFEDLYRGWLEALRYGDDETQDHHARSVADFIRAADTRQDRKERSTP